MTEDDVRNFLTQQSTRIAHAAGVRICDVRIEWNTLDEPDEPAKSGDEYAPWTVTLTVRRRRARLYKLSKVAGWGHTVEAAAANAIENRNFRRADGEIE